LLARSGAFADHAHRIVPSTVDHEKSSVKISTNQTCCNAPKLKGELTRKIDFRLTIKNLIAMLRA
jgi:hypothetical protein